MTDASLILQLNQTLKRRKASSARRAVLEYAPVEGGKSLKTPDGPPLLNLASNDYLALAHHPAVKQAAADACFNQGVGTGSSRLVTGTHPELVRCEQAFTRLKHPNQAGREQHASLLMANGFTANLAVLTALAGKDDLIVIDKLVHASLVDAARMSQATVRSFPHLASERLDALLTKHGPAARRRFIVTDSVFSMDGDCADLPALCELADRHDATLIVDEAHATGLLGPHGEGLAAAQGVQPRVDVSVSTCSKALGGQGGVITAHRAIIDTIVNEARCLIYTTGVMPPLAAAARAALRIAAEDTGRRQHLLALSAWFRSELTQSGWRIPPTSTPTPIIPLIAGGNQAALGLAQALKNDGYLGVAIRPPTVAPGAARVRLTLRADFTQDDLNPVITTLDRWRHANG